MTGLTFIMGMEGSVESGWGASMKFFLGQSGSLLITMKASVALTFRTNLLVKSREVKVNNLSVTRES